MAVFRHILPAVLLSVALLAQGKEAPFSDETKTGLARLVQLAYTNSLPSYDFRAYTLLTKNAAEISRVRRDVVELHSELLGAADPNVLVEDYVAGLLSDESIQGGTNRYTQRFRKSGPMYRVDMAKGLSSAQAEHLYRTYVNSDFEQSEDATNFHMSYPWKTLTIKGLESGPVRENALWRAFAMHELVGGMFLYWTVDQVKARKVARSDVSKLEFSDRLTFDSERVESLIDGKHKLIRPRVSSLTASGSTLIEFDAINSDVPNGEKTTMVQLVCDGRDFTKIYFSGIWTKTSGWNLDAFALRSFDEQSGQVRGFAFLKRMNSRKEKFRVAQILDSDLATPPPPAVFQPTIPEGWSLIDRRGEFVREYKNGELVFEVKKDTVESGGSLPEANAFRILFPMVSGLFLFWLAIKAVRRQANAR